MKMKKALSVSGALLLAVNVYGGNVDGNAVLGSALGAAAGSAIGSATGGKDGAIIGGGVGGAIGAAVGGKNEPAAKVVTHERAVTTQNVIIVDDHHDNGKHKGHYKHKNKHGHDRD